MNDELVFVESVFHTEKKIYITLNPFAIFVEDALNYFCNELIILPTTCYHVISCIFISVHFTDTRFLCLTSLKTQSTHVNIGRL